MAKMENYRQAQVMTSSPMELVMMLYDECIKSLNSAEQAFSLEEPIRLQETNNQLLHAQDIITELCVSLDIEKGGEIALNLQRLYDFMTQHLSRANVRKEVEPIREVRNLMCELREAWQQVAEKEPAGNAGRPDQNAVAGNVLVAG